MTLPASPPISAQDINVELGRAPTAPFSMNGAEERALAGIPAGTIQMTDFLGKSASSIAFVDSDTVNGVINSHSFTGLNFGPASADRVLVAAVLLEGAYFDDVNSITSMTIGGVAATGVTTGTTTDIAGVEGYCTVSLFSANVPSGTSGTVTVPFFARTSNMAIILVAITGSAPTVTDIVQDVAASQGVSLNVALDVPADGFIIAAGVNRPASDITFSGITGRSTTATAAGRLEVGYDAGQSPATDRAIGTSWPDTANRGLAAASFAPS